MERPESENGSCRMGLGKNRERVMCTPRRILAVPPVVRAPAAPASSELKLAALAVDLNVRLRSADMPAAMQERAIRHARVLLDANPENQRPSSTQLAMCLKKVRHLISQHTIKIASSQEFDAIYGPAWHCIVGKSFGSFVTHSTGGFLYFSVDKLSFLLFKTEVRPVIKSPPPLLKLITNGSTNNVVKSSY